MNALLIMLAIITGTFHSGYAAHYAPGVMERVAEKRSMGESGACMVASPYYMVGQWVRVKSAYHEEVCQVVDVAHPRDRRRLILRGIIVELDWHAAKEFCGVRERPEDCPVIVMLERPA